MDFSFFLTDNKSGYKTKEKWFQTNHPVIYNEIITYCSNLNIEIPSFKEKIFFYFNQKSERPKCVTCSSEIPFRGRFDKPYGEFCSLDCFNGNNQEMIKRQKKTFNDKYGIDFYPQHSEFIKKQRQTKEVRYGNQNFNNVSKMKNTKMIKYGDENFNNLDKYIETCLTKYGSTNYFSSNNYKNIVEDNFRKIYEKLNIKNIDDGVVRI